MWCFLPNPGILDYIGLMLLLLKIQFLREFVTSDNQFPYIFNSLFMVYSV